MFEQPSISTHMCDVMLVSRHLRRLVWTARRVSAFRIYPEDAFNFGLGINGKHYATCTGHDNRSLSAVADQALARMKGLPIVR